MLPSIRGIHGRHFVGIHHKSTLIKSVNIVWSIRWYKRVSRQWRLSKPEGCQLHVLRWQRWPSNGHSKEGIPFRFICQKEFKCWGRAHFFTHALTKWPPPKTSLYPIRSTDDAVVRPTKLHVEKTTKRKSMTVVMFRSHLDSERYFEMLASVGRRWTWWQEKKE